MGVDLVLYRIEKGDTIFCNDKEIKKYRKFPIIMDNIEHKKIAQSSYNVDRIAQKLSLKRKSIAPVSVTNDGVIFSDGEQEKLLTNDYLQKYTITSKQSVWCIDVDEIVYQRDGLTDEGIEILKDTPYQEYIVDKSLVENMVEIGGLDNEFLEKWEDGKTAFMWYQSGWGV